MTILIYGLGRSGVAAAKRVLRDGHSVVFFDANVPQHEELQHLSAVPTTTPIQTAKQQGITVCIAAPGVPWDHPDLIALRTQGVEVIGEVEWVYRTVNADIIGITATAGKTTVTAWLNHCLQQAGHHALAGGNIDPALCEVAEEGATLVTELSSFQLERCPTLKPKIAIIMNLAQDHLDRHGTLHAYYQAKRQLIAHQDANDLFIFNADDPLLSSWAQTHQGRIQSYSLTHPADAHLHENQELLMLHGEPLLPKSDLKVAGTHGLGNALAVALACWERGLTLTQIRSGLKSFAGVLGRYNVVDTIGNVRFIEDSIATRTLAVHAALTSTLGPIVWILGGQDKGASFEDLEALVRERVQLCIGIGEAGPAFTQKLSQWAPTTLCQDTDGTAALRCACETGLAALKETGGTVLLAPMAASFDQFANYKTRAAAFRTVVAKLHREMRLTEAIRG